MCSVTVGGPSDAYSEIGGPMEPILFPINHGILNFVGFLVVEPFVVYAPSRLSPEDRLAHLARYRARVLDLNAAPTIPMPALANYDGMVRKPGKRP